MFSAQQPPGMKCQFCARGEVCQVALGFEVSAGEFITYYQEIDPETGKALWGALIEPYWFRKCQNWAAELPQ